MPIWADMCRIVGLDVRDDGSCGCDSDMDILLKVVLQGAGWMSGVV